jgi:hypothetical protein
MVMSVADRFLNNNEMLIESPCDLKVGDVVTFTNDYGVSFENMIVIGFAKPEHYLHGRFIHISSDSPWFPTKRESLTLETRSNLETFPVVYPNGTTIHFHKVSK